MISPVEALQAALGPRPVETIDALLIAERIRLAISSGALPVGAKVAQQALADHFGVSRMPVREAIRLVQAQGLLSNARHTTPEVQSLPAIESAEFELAQARLRIKELEGALRQVRQEIDGACQCSADKQIHAAPLAIIERALPANAA